MAGNKVKINLFPVGDTLIDLWDNFNRYIQKEHNLFLRSNRDYMKEYEYYRDIELKKYHCEHIIEGGNKYYIIFETEEDYLAFKLKYNGR
jgi:hypothetical protein